MLLPSLTDFLRTRWDMSAARINLMIVRTSLSFLLVGTSIITVAQTIPLLIFGQSSLCEGVALVTFLFSYVRVFSRVWCPCTTSRGCFHLHYFTSRDGKAVYTNDNDRSLVPPGRRSFDSSNLGFCPQSWQKMEYTPISCTHCKHSANVSSPAANIGRCCSSLPLQYHDSFKRFP